MTTNRTRRSGSKHDLGQEHARADLTPMIDVTFLLLIFFMLTIQFKTLEGQLAAHMPEGVGSGTSEPRDDVDLRIEVLREGTRLAVGGDQPWSGAGPWRYASDRVVRWSVGPWTTQDADELGPRLASLFRDDPDRRLVIDARPGAVYAEAVIAVDAARLAGCNDIGFTRH